MKAESVPLQGNILVVIGGDKAFASERLNKEEVGSIKICGRDVPVHEKILMITMNYDKTQQQTQEARPPYPIISGLGKIYLEFLRNLPVQIILISNSIVFFMNASNSCFKTSIAILTTLATAVAVWVNVVNNVDETLSLSAGRLEKMHKVKLNLLRFTVFILFGTVFVVVIYQAVRIALSFIKP